jgi:CRISPR-associated protein Cmr4
MVARRTGKEAMTSQKGTVFFVRALTPVHIGVDIGLGAINLPTLRESITRHPVIPGSSFKGVLRDLAEHGLSLDREANVQEKEQRYWAAFGPSRANASDYRGGLVLSDARLLLLPLPSLKGTFAWATSRFVLNRLNRDLEDAGIARLRVPDGEDTCVTKSSKLRLEDGRISLREVLVQGHHDNSDVDPLAETLATYLWSKQDRVFFTERFAVLPDAVFDAFARSSLEVRARVAIDSERGTAERSGPWTEEHIPAETVLAGLAFGRKTAYRTPSTRGHESKRDFAPEEMIEVFTDAVQEGRSLRLGGHSSVGLGRVYLTCARPS